MKISCIIVEDEPLALKRTKSYVLKTPALELVGSFENANEALQFLLYSQVDLIFLDIQMDELTGIELLESADIKSKVIFTTAYEEYAIKGYELNVLDYLLKPFTYKRFLQAINKFESVNNEPANHIFVQSGYQLEKVYLDDILYIEGMGDYRRIHTVTNKKVMTLQTFKAFQQLLPKLKFHRVHKSYLVAIDQIDIVERNSLMIRQERIPISASYKDDFHRFIKQLKG
ncbi:MAG: LytTR family DNA-binding domain-containing protein [Flavobacteriales bacterium]|jgi:DNA-binding LytR/AlgR family response regulator|nr:LytTR family DNA-binding domain-containing protein [Flavobacteriales bacterium]